MKAINKYLCGLFALVLMSSCSYDFPEVEEQTLADLGEINPENVVVIGDDYLAGLMDGALYSSGQENSIAGIFTSQISKIQEVPFIQANIDSENGFNIYTSTQQNIYGKWIYKFENQTDQDPKLVLLPGEEIQNYSGDKSLLNDVAAPLLSVMQIQDANFDENPFLSRVFSGDNTNLIDQIVTKPQSLVYCWLGMNDFLEYAINGATVIETLTPVEDFKDNIEILTERIINETEAKIVLSNLISFQDLPYFYSRVYNSLFLDKNKLSKAMSHYSIFNSAVSEHNRDVSEELQRPYIDFNDNGGSNLHPQSLVIIDNKLPEASYPDGTPLEKFRQLNEKELVFYTISDDMLKDGMGWLVPISENKYLNEDEITLIEDRVTAFNSIIENIAKNHSDRIVLVDAHKGINQIAETGKTDAWGEPILDEVYYFDGIPIEGSLGLNSIFSLDGLHFNQRGNAFVGNIFIDAINRGFNANIETSDINNYVGNTYSN